MGLLSKVERETEKTLDSSIIEIIFSQTLLLWVWMDPSAENTCCLTSIALSQRASQLFIDMDSHYLAEFIYILGRKRN